MLNPGTKLGPYEIVSPAGAGGMGEVYRARDTRLDRTVAIKVMPDPLSSSLELRQRFEREARAVSSLNHPHICHLYDVGADGGTNFLVMEYVEGETLAERLEKGPLPLEQVLRVGIEIADALDKAHRQGIVHRDLKPGNVMLTKSGAKLMDFGLAKPTITLAEASGRPAPITPSTPTMSMGALALSAAPEPLTKHGMIVGTFQYMAPEVLQGAEADARSDIFSFGCVLYEMVTGKKAFDGKSQISVLAAILEKEPEPVSHLQPLTPLAVDRLVRSCLTKDADERIQNAHDLRLELRSISETGPTVTATEATGRRNIRLTFAVIAAAMVVVTAAVAFFAGATFFRRAEQPLQFQLNAPANTVFNFRGLGGMPSVSPDGKNIVFSISSSGQAGGRALWLRRLDSVDTRLLPDTANATFPFWSPDSRYIAFFANGKLRKLDVVGSTLVTICDVGEGRGGTWSKDGVIVFGTRTGGLFKVSAAGGEVVPVTKLDTSHSEANHRWPQFLPDQKHFLYEAQAPTGRLLVGSTDTQTQRAIGDIGTNAAFSGGKLLYVDDGNLFARPFDPDRLKFTGDPLVVAEHIQTDPQFNSAAFSIGGNVLAYQPGTASAGTRLVALDSAGKETLLSSDPSLWNRISVSPKGDQLAGAISEYGDFADIWIYNLQKNSKTRLTFDKRSDSPVWSHDGSMIAFSRGNLAGGYEIVAKSASGTGAEEVLLREEKGHDAFPIAWTPDGRYLVYEAAHPEYAVMAVPVRGEHKPVLLVSSNATMLGAALSADGRWLAYASAETGLSEVYVVPFRPEAGANHTNDKWQVSSGGGARPVWSADGKTLFFTSTSQTGLQSTSVSADGDRLETTPPKYLFDLSAHPVNRFLAPARDGRHFYMTAYGPGSTAPITVTVNWTALLKK